MTVETYPAEPVLQPSVAFRNILLPIDFSPASQSALRLAQTMARRYGAKLHVLHVLVPDVYSLVAAAEVMPVHQIAEQRAEAEMEKVRQSCRSAGVQHEELVRDGTIGDALRHVLCELDVDLIVVGTSGAGGIRKLLLGSVAEEIFRASACPVMTVGPELSPGMQQGDQLRSVVYCTDFSDPAEAALPYAVSLAREHRAQLTLLHVVEKIADPSPFNQSRLREIHLPALHRLVPAERGLRPHYCVRFGPPVVEIVEFARGVWADLIVLGVRRADGFASHLPWAVASQVVRRASCPVLTVRH